MTSARTGRVPYKSRNMERIRIGYGFDIHALAEGLPLTLGGVAIPFGKGCVAHSDGDAAIHALCDALLGAAALGDIGKHFPDTSPEYAGIDSFILLERVVELLHVERYDINNADITIVLQEPKLAGYIDMMRARLACAMRIDIGRVSVKATTAERLGFAGRGEGVAAHAVVTVVENL